MPLSRGWFPRTLIEQLEALLKIALMAGAVFAVSEYFDGRRDLRVARTLDFIARFDGADYAVPRRTVAKAMADARAQLADGQLDIAGLDPEARRELGERTAFMLVQGEPGKPGVGEEVNQIAGFFSSLQICIEQEICDARAAHGVFDAYARSFWAAFKPVFLAARPESPGAGAGLERFAAGGR